MTQEKSKRDEHYKKVYRQDGFARRVINISGFGVILSILAILLFLIYQSLPLGSNASVTELFTIDANVSGQKVILTGIDPYQEVIYLLQRDGRVRFFRLSDQELILDEQVPLDQDEVILSASKGSLMKEVVALGTNQGRIFNAEIQMRPVYRGGSRTIQPSISFSSPWLITTESDTSARHVEKLVYRQNEDLREYWCWQDHSGRIGIKIFDADDEEEIVHDLASQLKDIKVSALTMSFNGDNLIIATESGKIYWFNTEDYETVELNDQFQASNVEVTALGYLLGDESIVVANKDGEVAVWFPIRSQSNLFKFRKIHTFQAHETEVTHVEVSSRNRSFISVDKNGLAKLHYSTTGETQLSFKPSDYPITAMSFAPKSNGIIAVDSRSRFAHFELNDPHPETSLRTLLGEVWYEGYGDPEFVWQSTGGSDEFEPKLSLVPLMFGTLKGTFYAMLFSVPIAVLAAIYVSQLSPAWIMRSVKPTVEIMAALPSVVIGFLAGLYFSPLFEKYLMTIFLDLLFVPIAFVVFILIWRRVPEIFRNRIKPGGEILIAMTIGLVGVAAAAVLAGTIEESLFMGNFPKWFYAELGITYETRNSVVVGFALGFAVIPIIFTVSEDALSNVPESLTSASLALGASKWQTVRRVVLPAASAGIFAAIMLGLGRAIGETMIVLMATGNTPIMDINPFSGFRAMSACIAVEVPEAPVGGTLYRVLFLTALLLFIFTFFLNSVSSLIGERLRKKYARF